MSSGHSFEYFMRIMTEKFVEFLLFFNGKPTKNVDGDTQMNGLMNEVAAGWNKTRKFGDQLFRRVRWMTVK